MRWVDVWGELAEFCKGCPVCQGSTWAVQPQREAFTSEGVRCACWEIYQSALVLWRRGFPKQYLTYFYDPGYPLDTSEYAPEVVAAFNKKFPISNTWQMSEEDDAALTYFTSERIAVERNGLSLFIYGAKGCGKTALATSLTMEVAKRYNRPSGPDGQWAVNFVSCDAIYEAVGNRVQSGRELIERCLDANFLVIDDLRLQATGFLADDAYERIHRILQHRSQNLLPTIITANKVGSEADFKPNSVSSFLGISKSIPERFGRYRMISLTNDPLRPEPVWSL